MLVNEHLRTARTSKKIDPVKTDLPFYHFLAIKLLLIML